MIKKLSVNDKDKFYELGSLINNNFINLYDLELLCDSVYDFLYGYYDNNTLIGFIHVTKIYESMDIVNIVVDVKYRRCGVASKLIDYAYLQFNDLEKILLEVNVNNKSAISLYEKNGFSVIDVRKKYYGQDDALIMMKEV